MSDPPLNSTDKQTRVNNNDFLEPIAVLHVVDEEVFHPEDLQQVNDDVEELMASSRRTAQKEYRILDKSGEIHWIHEQIQKANDPTGRKESVYENSS